MLLNPVQYAFSGQLTCLARFWDRERNYYRLFLSDVFGRYLPNLIVHLCFVKESLNVVRQALILSERKKNYCML
jgi:hypothetical protein